MKLNRRELFTSGGVALVAAQLPAQSTAQAPVSTAQWLTTCRTMICEAYTVPRVLIHEAVRLDLT